MLTKNCKCIKTPQAPQMPQAETGLCAVFCLKVFHSTPGHSSISVVYSREVVNTVVFSPPSFRIEQKRNLQ